VDKCSQEHISVCRLLITPKAIQDLLDELEASKLSRLRAWAVLQRIRAILSESAHMVIEQPAKKTFESKGAILERALIKCVRDRQAALKDLADAARRVDKAAFGEKADFGPAHQALLKALDQAGDFI
jgi:hypothetical protein